MIFRQLFEPVSSTYTYLLACPRTRQAALIDSVLEETERYVALLAELGLTLVYTLETHVHADHVTAAAALRDQLGSRAALARASGVTCADRLLDDGDVLPVGDLAIEVRATPGHTDSCVAYLAEDRVFTGDALLIGGCGRTDFQQGNAGRLYDNVTTRILSLPPDTLVYPAHDYKGRTVSTVREELATNARLGGGKTRDEFVAIMHALTLAPPKQLHRAVPANLACGRAPSPPEHP
jgi:glyoxylase-like metal-dependent hydrolase (beta-lactamase superfamily II)